jgi:hypothetical protein
MHDATFTRCTSTPNNIRANNRPRDCNQQYRSATAPEATIWGVSVQLLHLVRNRWQCDVRPVFGRCERVLLHRAIQILKRDTLRLYLAIAQKSWLTTFEKVLRQKHVAFPMLYA